MLLVRDPDKMGDSAKLMSADGPQWSARHRRIFACHTAHRSRGGANQ